MAQQIPELACKNELMDLFGNCGEIKASHQPAGSSARALRDKQEADTPTAGLLRRAGPQICVCGQEEAETRGRTTAAQRQGDGHFHPLLLPRAAPAPPPRTARHDECWLWGPRTVHSFWDPRTQPRAWSVVDAKSGFTESMNTGQQHLLNVTYKSGLEGWEQGIPSYMDGFPDKTLMPRRCSHVLCQVHSAQV